MQKKEIERSPFVSTTQSIFYTMYRAFQTEFRFIYLFIHPFIHTHSKRGSEILYSKEEERKNGKHYKIIG